MTVNWTSVACALERRAAREARLPSHAERLDKGQRATLRWIAQRIGESGLVLADEVGTGKTRIACAVVQAVIESGGRAAVVVPHGLMHQWVDEAQKLDADSPEPKTLTTLAEFLRNVQPNDESWNQHRPDPNGAEWWLLSHGFRAPQVRINTEDWRAALPGMVEMMLATPAALRDKRTRLGKLRKTLDRNPDSRWSKLGRIARDIAARLAALPELRQDIKKRIRKLPELVALRTGKKAMANLPLRRAFNDDEAGRLLTEELLGVWLGAFDLLVIDEAHKSRGDDGEDDSGSAKIRGPLLERLLENLLKQPKSGKRLCLTATPMELELKNWVDLLKRAGCKLDRAAVKIAIKEFQEAARQARKAPDEGRRLDDLCKAARKFTVNLKDFVTRRRRDDDEIVADFRAAAGEPQRPHPYRRLERISVPWTDATNGGTSSAWIEVLFAAEGMSHSACGLSKEDTKNWPKAIRDAYTKLQQGYVSADLIKTAVPVPKPGTADAQARNKIARVAYWYRTLRQAHDRVVNREEKLPEKVEIDPEADHPRILAAVKEIELWTTGDRAEKVLVFGVFVHPLRVLTDVLNVRHALREADARRPLAHQILSDPHLCGIALRQLHKMQNEGTLSGRLASATWPDVNRALQDSHRDYERRRRGVREAARKCVARWRADPSLLAGARPSGKLDAVLQERLVSFAVDEFLRTPGAQKPAAEAVQALAEEFYRERMVPLLSEIDQDEKSVENQALLRQEALRLAFVEHDDVDNRQSLHARFLHGETKWGTRRYLQAAFNRRGASPSVLVAQSQVGREGLNLHEACRIVLQFHAEWNPAVIEQQIGRVDRKGSLWEHLFNEWRRGGRRSAPPFIEIRQLLFDGTYDAFQWDRVMRRQHDFNASLFGDLLPPEVWERVPEERRAKLIEFAPNFSPLLGVRSLA